MAASSPGTILLKGEQRRIEREAGGAITPGDILELNSSDNLIVHATDEGIVLPRMIALENDIAGDDLTHDYAVNEVVQAHVCNPGDEVLARAGANETISIGDYVVSEGNGNLRALSGESAAVLAGAIFGIAIEAKTTDTANSSPRFKVMVV